LIRGNGGPFQTEVGRGNKLDRPGYNPLNFQGGGNGRKGGDG